MFLVCILRWGLLLSSSYIDINIFMVLVPFDGYRWELYTQECVLFCFRDNVNIHMALKRRQHYQPITILSMSIPRFIDIYLVCHFSFVFLHLEWEEDNVFNVCMRKFVSLNFITFNRLSGKLYYSMRNMRLFNTFGFSLYYSYNVRMHSKIYFYFSLDLYDCSPLHSIYSNWLSFLLVVMRVC